MVARVEQVDVAMGSELARDTIPVASRAEKAMKKKEGISATDLTGKEFYRRAHASQPLPWVMALTLTTLECDINILN